MDDYATEVDFQWAREKVAEMRKQNFRDGPSREATLRRILELEEAIAMGAVDVLRQWRREDELSKAKEKVESYLRAEMQFGDGPTKKAFRRLRLELEEAITTGTVEAYWQRVREENKEAIARRNAEFLQRRRVATVSYAYNWLGEEYQERGLDQLTFENFTRALQPKAYDAAREIAANPQGTLILAGPPGVGKTHLLAAICNDFNSRIDHNTRGSFLYVKLRNLQGVIHEMMLNNEPTRTMINKAINAHLLAIDELDKAKAGDFTQRTAFDVIDGRWQAGLPMVIATNDSDYLEELLGEAIMSRLSDNGRVVTLQGNDYRLGRRYGHSSINGNSAQ